jgi:hypothetical protein
LLFLQERLGLEGAMKKLEKDGVDKGDARLKEILDELERVDGETEMVNESIRERQEELLSMETSGVQLAEGSDMVSQSGLQLINDMSADEAQALLRDFFSKLVKQEIGSQKFRVRIKELNAEIQRKDAMLKSFMSSGVSTTDGILYGNDQDQSLLGGSAISLNIDLPDIPEERERAASLNVTTSGGGDAPSSSSAAASFQRPRSLSPRPRSGPPPALVESDAPQSPKAEAKQVSLKRRTIEVNPPAPAPAKPEYRDGGTKTFENMLRSNSSKRRVSTKVIQDEIIVERQVASAASKRGQVSKLQLTHTITGHEDEVLCLAADNNTLITGSKDKSVKIWDMEAGKIVATLPGHEYHVKAISLASPQFFTVSK